LFGNFTIINFVFVINTIIIIFEFIFTNRNFIYAFLIKVIVSLFRGSQVLTCFTPKSITRQWILPEDGPTLRTKDQTISRP
jgi:hypothetical protein